jgi:hypothetical protein
MLRYLSGLSLLMAHVSSGQPFRRNLTLSKGTSSGQWAEVALTPPLAQLLNFFLLLMPIVDDVLGITNVLEAVLQGDARSYELGGLCPLLQDEVVCGFALVGIC